MEVAVAVEMHTEPTLRLTERGVCLASTAQRARRSTPRGTTLVTHQQPCTAVLPCTSLATGPLSAQSARRTTEGAVVSLVPSDAVDKADRGRRELIAAAVHDLRHRLSIQTLLLELLAAEPAACLPNHVTTLLGKLRLANTLVVTETDALLNCVLVDLDAVHLRAQQVSVATVVQALSVQLEPLLQTREQRLTARVGTDLLVWADPSALQHMLFNLLLNAHRYSTAGDTIVITAHHRPGEETIEIVVRDHGPGIPKHERVRIFERFYRGAQADGTKGVGLGLPLVRSCAARHGGASGIRSGRGGGTAFWVRLPTPSGAAEQEQTAGVTRYEASA